MGFPNRDDFSPDFRTTVEPLFRAGESKPPSREDTRDFALNLAELPLAINIEDFRKVGEKLKNARIISPRELGELMKVTDADELKEKLKVVCEEHSLGRMR